MDKPDPALLARIQVNPEVLVGKPTVRGLRISVEQVLRALSAGVAPKDLLSDFPDLEEADIRAVMAYAADLVAGENVYPLSGA